MRVMAFMSAMALVGVSNAAVLFSDDFNAYPNGNLVTTPANGGWAERSAGSNPIQVTGGVVSLTSTGQDAVSPIVPSISFDPTLNPSSIGFSFYLAADVNISTAKTGDYFLHTSGSPTSSSFQSRVYVRSEGTGFVFGTAVTSNPPTYGTEVLNLNETYRVVVRYTVNEGASNDAVSLFAFPLSALPASEPAIAYATNVQSGSGDASGLGSVNLRQGATASGPILTVDNILVTDDFNQVVPEPAALSLLGLSSLLLGRRRARRQ